MTRQSLREKNRQELISLMAERDLDRDSLAELVGVSPWSVDAWLKPETSASSNPVKAHILELIRLKMPIKSKRRA